MTPSNNICGPVKSTKLPGCDKDKPKNSELRTQKFIQHNSQRLNASNNANLLS